MAITIYSFGYKHGPAPTGAKEYDCRALRNPHHDAELRPLTGKDEPVKAFVREDMGATRLIGRVVREAQDGATLAFGCIGGRHRSVAVAEMVAELLRMKTFEVAVHHRVIG